MTVRGTRRSLAALFVGLRWHPAELTLPPGPLLLGSRTELVYRRRRRRPVAITDGRLDVALLCEERVVVGAGENQSTRTAVVVRHVIEAPLTVTPAGVEARFTVEIPLVAGAPTLRIRSASFSLDGWLAEVGGAFQGRIAYHPRADQAGRATGIRLRLAYRTSGVGAAVHRVVAEQRWTIEPGVPFGTPFLVGVPGLEPISYDGQLLSIQWEMEVTATRPWRADHSVTALVLVVPVGGAALYRTAHPYRPLPD